MGPLLRTSSPPARSSNHHISAAQGDDAVLRPTLRRPSSHSDAVAAFVSVPATKALRASGNAGPMKHCGLYVTTELVVFAGNAEQPNPAVPHLKTNKNESMPAAPDAAPAPAPAQPQPTATKTMPCNTVK